MLYNTWAQFKSNVINRMTDIIPQNSYFTEACAMYVRSYLSREVDHDIIMAKSYQDRYMELRRRLLGFQTDLVPGSTLDNVVRTYLPVDATRQGVQLLIAQLINNAYFDLSDLSQFLDRALREVAVDLQTFIPSYRKTQTSVYFPEDVSQVGGLSRGAIPSGAQLYEAWLLESVEALAENVTLQIGDLVASNGRTYMVLQGGLIGTGLLGAGLKTVDGSVETLGGMTFTFKFYDTVIRSPMKQYDWHVRYEFDQLKLNNRTRRMPAAIMIDQDTHTFYAWPFLNANPPPPVFPETYTPTLYYQILWTSPTTFHFSDDTLVAFDDEAESAAAEYVWSKFYQSVEKDRLQAQQHASAYGSFRSKLVAEHAAKGRIKYTR